MTFEGDDELMDAPHVVRRGGGVHCEYVQISTT